MQAVPAAAQAAVFWAALWPLAPCALYVALPLASAPGVVQPPCAVDRPDAWPLPLVFCLLLPGVAVASVPLQQVVAHRRRYAPQARGSRHLPTHSAGSIPRRPAGNVWPDPIDFRSQPFRRAWHSGSLLRLGSAGLPVVQDRA